MAIKTGRLATEGPGSTELGKLEEVGQATEGPGSIELGRPAAVDEPKDSAAEGPISIELR